MKKSFIRFMFVVSFVYCYSNQVFAENTYCNNYGSTTVCNTYHIDGTMDQQQINTYGNTTVVTESSTSDK